LEANSQAVTRFNVLYKPFVDSYLRRGQALKRAFLSNPSSGWRVAFFSALRLTKNAALF
jgi:hypothetical protein